MLTATADGTYTPPACPVTSCTQEMQTKVALTCRMPHLDSVAPHPITLSTVDGGDSPVLTGASITTPATIRAFTPSSGSVAGGTVIAIYGDGLSTRRGDIDVTIGGNNCRVLTSNTSHVTCVAPVAVFVNVGSVEKTLSSRILPHCVQQLRERRGRDGQNRWSRARIHSSARRTK